MNIANQAVNTIDNKIVIVKGGCNQSKHLNNLDMIQT